MKPRRTKLEEQDILEKLRRLRAKILNENKALRAFIDAITGEAINSDGQLTKKS